MVASDRKGIQPAGHVCNFWEVFIDCSCMRRLTGVKEPGLGRDVPSSDDVVI
jgi:hypothetical protein